MNMFTRIKTAVKVAWVILRGRQMRMGVITRMNGERNGNGWSIELECRKDVFEMVTVMNGRSCTGVQLYEKSILFSVNL